MKGKLPTLLVLGGATATGKTAMAIRLAQHLDTVILSADSRQFYREMTIGTAKPTPAELVAAPHYFINSHSVQTPYSVGAYERDAMQVLNEVFQKRPVAILAGGSGLFISAVCTGLDHFPPISAATKAAVQAQVESEGIQGLQASLGSLDPAYFAVVDRENPARLQRAVEVCIESGQPYSAFLNQTRVPRPFRLLQIQLDLPRPALYARIDQRVDQMIAQGLEAEVRSLEAFRDLSAMRTVGYEEWFEYFEGRWTYAETVDKIKQHSRNYAKRQLTWFRKYGEWSVFSSEEADKILTFVEERL